ncbi:hypothetical protein L9F63_009903 [Diploptera punctata]|uniref:Farnesol dehydrogenase n=1 Tax=Diploptera punctata TaxID=6984 RepID=A0AAD8AID6_DIPPU|nr:hypothetical protein L9F63_009903 [Diploptera punctata]
MLNIMERWVGRVAVVTGASAGIGASIAEELVKKGLKVVGLARRVERVEELKKNLTSAPGKLFPRKCDVMKEEDVKAAFKWIKSELKRVDILINNAGNAMQNTLIDGPVEHWKHIMDLNVMALSMCTKEALQIMKETGVDDGHIIHINSVVGHEIAPRSIMYSASKHAVTVLTEGLRRELIKQNSKIRVTSVSPGPVKTEFATASKIELPPGLDLSTFPFLESIDVANAVLYVLETPPHVQVHELIKKPRWVGRVAVVTGASSGIGASVTEELVKKGLVVVALARRVEKIEELQKGLTSAPGKLYPRKCDVTKEDEIKATFKWIKSELKGVDILINNAGVGLQHTLTDGPVDHWSYILSLNVVGLSMCTKEALHIMKENGVDDGHIIHINSIAGHKMPMALSMYSASKHAVTVLTEGLRRELVKQKSKIRVTSISPGAVKSEFIEASKMIIPPEWDISKFPFLESVDIANGILYVLGTPPHVQIHELTIKPVGEIF